MESSFSAKLSQHKDCLHKPQSVFAWDRVERLFGRRPPSLTASEVAALSEEERHHRMMYSYRVAAFMQTAPDYLLWSEVRVLYNVRPDLTGDLSGLWGDAGGLTGRVNSGTTGNVTGLVGRMDNIWGDVSNIFGKIHGHLHGTVSRLGGDISRKWGYCSEAYGDVSGIHGDLTPFSGDLTGLSGNAAYFAQRLFLFQGRDTRLNRRLLKNHVWTEDSGRWTYCWGDAANVRGRNDGVVGDLTNEYGDLSGRRYDTAFKAGPGGPQRDVHLVILPYEGQTAERPITRRHHGHPSSSVAP